MYVCGMTVYDYCHLGHARVMVVFDMVARWFRASGYDVTYVRNITDIDDKIIQRANEVYGFVDKVDDRIRRLTNEFIYAMDEDSAKLGIIRPDIEPRATEHVQGMLDMISQLIAKGFAYQADNGDVFYKVRSFNDYGKLSGKSLDDLRAGERVDVDGHKQDPLDFVLWKSAKPGEPYWESPWGNGRPGWHIECSVMSAEHLGQHFDIHGGGQDLQFPHHENEIAQSEATHGCTMANYWMHNGFIKVDDEKMSKSLGNFFTIREVIKYLNDKYCDEKKSAEIIRFFILNVHYRSPLNYSINHLSEAESNLRTLYSALHEVPPSKPSMPSTNINWSNPIASRFKKAMDDDFNTRNAIVALFDQVKIVKKTRSSDESNMLKALANILGLLDYYNQNKPESITYPTEFLKIHVNATLSAPAPHVQGNFETTHTDETIQRMINIRSEAKTAKNYAEADRIRKELAEAGIILEDTPQGTTWRRA